MTTNILSLGKLQEIISSSTSALKRAWRRVWRVFSFSLADEAVAPGKSLSAAIEKGKISIVYGTRSFSRIRVLGSREVDFEPDRYPKPEETAVAILRAMRELKAAKTGISLCIPGDWTIAKTTEFPAVVKENLSGVVSYELDRITPLKPEDAYYDFRCLREEGDKLHVLVEAAKQDFIDAYLKALTDKGLCINRVTNRLSAMGTWLSDVSGRSLIIFVEIERDGYRGGLVFNGVTERTFAGGFQEHDNVSRMQAVADKIDVISNWRQSEDASQFVFATANDRDHMILAELLPERFKLFNASAMDPSLIRNHGKASYEAVGCLLESLSPNTRALNLLSKGAHVQKRTPMAVTAFLSIALIAMGVLYIVAPIQIEERRVREFERQIDLKKDEVKKVEALKKETETLEGEIAAIENFKFKRPELLDIFREVTVILPKGAWLSRMRITNTTVDIEGYAKTATELLPKLEASKYLKKVEFASPTFRDARLDAERFVMKMEIEDPRMEGDRDAKEE